MRPSFLYPLFASPSSVRGVGDKYAALLENLGIGKIIDLLWHLPYAVNDRRGRLPSMLSKTAKSTPF